MVDGHVVRTPVLGKEPRLHEEDWGTVSPRVSPISSQEDDRSRSPTTLTQKGRTQKTSSSSLRPGRGTGDGSSTDTGSRISREPTGSFRDAGPDLRHTHCSRTSTQPLERRGSPSTRETSMYQGP